jgi:hypothetical protein
MSHHHQTTTVPLLLSQVHLTTLMLSAIKVDLVNDLAGGMFRYQLARPVADIILSLTMDEIHLIAEQSSTQNVLRVANGNSPAFWTDLKQAASNRDRTAVSLSLVQSLLMGVPPTASI